MESFQKREKNSTPAHSSIGVLALGQTPRPDLNASMRTVLPENITIHVRGGLDGLTPEQMDVVRSKNGTYPLMVRLVDGTIFEADMHALMPHLTHQATMLAHDGARLILLMCSGGFPPFEVSVAVLRPISLLLMNARILAARGRVGIISPIASQQKAAAICWRKEGFTVMSAHASPFSPETVCAAAEFLSETDVDLIVLDCMSFDDNVLEQVKSRTQIPVLSPIRLVQAFVQTWH